MDDSRSKVIPIRVTEREYEQIAAAAEKEKCAVSSWGARVLVAALPRRRGQR